VRTVWYSQALRSSRSKKAWAYAVDSLRAAVSGQPEAAFQQCPPDIVITVCDKAAGESCPVYFGPALKAHWGLEDPSDVVGEEEAANAAFVATLARIERRCRAFFELPLSSLDPEALRRELHRIATL
jgi:arsenate reductase